MFQENSKKCKKCRTYEVTLNKNVLRKSNKCKNAQHPKLQLTKMFQVQNSENLNVKTWLHEISHRSRVHM